MHELLEDVGQKHDIERSKGVGKGQNVNCYVEKLSALGMKRGKYRHSLNVIQKPVCYTSYGCGVCRVRLCKTCCFPEFHLTRNKQWLCIYTAVTVVDILNLCCCFFRDYYYWLNILVTAPYAIRNIRELFLSNSSVKRQKIYLL